MRVALPIPTRLFLFVAPLVIAALALGCSGDSSKTTTSRPTPARPPATTVVNVAPATVAAAPTATVAAPTATVAVAAGVSGTWSGTYSGASSGTFTLTWQQSGTKVSGTIKISSFNNSAIDINGNLQGNAISFGTVGSQAITYTGTVSGNSMSGSWQIQGGAGGSWSASKS